MIRSEGHWHIRDDDTEEEEAEENFPHFEGANVGHHCFAGHQTVS